MYVGEAPRPTENGAFHLTAHVSTDPHLKGVFRTRLPGPEGQRIVKNE
jgi:hypothetical protein